MRHRPDSENEFERTAEFVVHRQKSRMMPEPPLVNPGEFLRSKEIQIDVQINETPIDYDLTET